ncbi:MAG TPA: hypothetical protein VJK54_06070 [Chthoniobacterales bacterium]|nr:hypothetical protein [Chthoniobacterales bacterium]
MVPVNESTMNRAGIIIPQETRSPKHQPLLLAYNGILWATPWQVKSMIYPCWLKVAERRGKRDYVGSYSLRDHHSISLLDNEGRRRRITQNGDWILRLAHHAGTSRKS